MSIHSALFGAALLLALAGGAPEVLVLSEPGGAEVWVDGIFRGRTGADGLRLRGLTPGSPLKLTLRRPGSRPAERTVDVPAEGETRVVVRLQDAPTPASAEAATSGPRKPSKTGLIVGVAASAAGAGVAAAVLTKQDPLEVDDDGDGFSEKQGDCQDRDAAVSPRGEFSVAVAPDLSGSVPCTAGYAPIEVKATNLGCTPVTISSITLVSALTAGDCFGGNFTVAVPVLLSTVVPGERDTLVGRRQFTGQVGCCPGGDCGPFSTVCSWGEHYIVATSAGEKSFTSSHTLIFPAGPSCPACADAGAAGAAMIAQPPRH